MTRPFITSVAACLALVLAAAAPAIAAPTADFTFAPTTVVAGEEVTFTSTSTSPGQPIVSTEWDFENDGVVDSTVPVATHTFGAAGTYDVTLRVVNDVQQQHAITRSIVVTAPPPPPPPPTPPTAEFTSAPAPPVAGSAATFTSTSSTVPGASIDGANVHWDFENDGTFDATGTQVLHTFAAAGAYTVRLHVVDSRNLTADMTHLVVVNAPPTAAFTAFPATPVVGDEVSLTSYSSDAEGALAAQLWDLDGDGDFDDASGAVVSGMFMAAGDHTISLLVKDNQGATATLSKTITALPKKGADPPGKREEPAAKGDPPAANVPAFVALVSPFPVVRLVGTVVRKGARIRMLAVRAPAGSRVYVNCRGAKCPARHLTKAVAATPVRFRALERYLPAGSVLEILVRRGQQIGKYTSFRIRRNRVPKRTDGCLPPWTSRSVKCPAG